MITTVPMGMSVELESVGGAAQRIQARILELAGHDTEIAVRAGGSRGGAKNAMIAKLQAAGFNRDPFYANPKTLKLLAAAAPALVAALPAIRARTAKAIGDILLINVHENVDKQRNPDGSTFKPLTPNYAAAKRRKFGFVTPILRATGDLLGGLWIDVIKGGDGDRG